jgi:protein disulfide-isomerase A6
MLVKTFLLGAFAAVAAAKSAVLDLTPSNFDDVVLKSGKPTLVEFFAPWCGHCKKLAPIYEELGLAFEHAKDKVQIAKVDADAEKSLGKRFGVQGFPTLKFFDGKSDTPLEYKSGRTLEALSEYITEKTGVKTRKKQELPSEVEVLNDSTFDAAIGGAQNVLVAFTAPWCGHCKKLAPTWETLATDFSGDSNVVIAKVDADAPNGKETAQKFGVTSYPTIKYFPAGSKEPVAYDGGRNEEDLIAYLNEQAGTHRVPGGGLNTAAGTVEALDTVVSKLTGSNIATIATEVNSEAEKLKETAQYKYAEYYVRVFDKLSSTDGYAAKELARLDGILSKGGLAPAKRDEIQSKTNVLRKVVKQLADKAEELKDEL